MGLQNGRGGTSPVLSIEKKWGGGAEKVPAMLKGEGRDLR